MFLFCVRAVLVLVSVGLAVSCKTTDGKARIRSAPESSKASIATIAEKLSPRQKVIIKDFLFELGRHIARFHNQPDLTGNLNKRLESCGNLRDSGLSTLMDKTFGSVRSCGANALNSDSELAAIAAVAKLKRSPALDKLIDSFNEDVLPTFVDALMESYEKSPKMDDAQMAEFMDLVGQVAVISKLAVNVIEWKPDYTSSVRFLNQIVLTELSRERSEDINWGLVKAATTARLDIFPLAPGDAALNPLVVPLHDPLYKILYGPTPRGAAYWIMTAASTVRLETYGGTRARYFDVYPESVMSLDVIPKQILLESQDDRVVIKRALKHLTHNYEKIM